MMTSLFSSDEATAVANFLVFAGLLLGILRIGRTWIGSFLSRFSAVVRRVRQKSLLDDLRKIRNYRLDKFKAVKDTTYGFFDDVMTTVSMVSVAGVGLLLAIAIDSNLKLAGQDVEIWQSIYSDPVYWVTVFAIWFGGLFILTIAILWSARSQLRFLKFAAEPEASRAELLNRYLKLRALR